MTDQMAPEASPIIASRKSGVRRVNNMPLYIIGGLFCVFLFIMMMVAADRAKKTKVADGPKEEKQITSTLAFANEIVGDQTGGVIEPVKQPEVPDLTYSIETQQAEAGLIENQDLEPYQGYPVPPQAGAVGDDSEAKRIRMEKLHMLEEAARAKTSVQIPTLNPGSVSGNLAVGNPQTRDEMLTHMASLRQQIAEVRHDDPISTYQARLGQIHNMGIGGNGGHTSAVGTRNGYSQFDSDSDDRWRLDSRPEPPRSPYELRAGFVLPAIMISGINSDLPGQVMAQVAQDVYDTPSGHYLLIPQGSRLVGSYSSDVAYGQSRMLIAWQRIVFPDGKAMDIGSMPGADSAGYTGFKDRVNNHYLRVFSSAFLMSAVVAGITLSQDDGSRSDSQRASDALSEAVGQQLGQVTAQMIAKNLNIAPTLAIRPGYRFNVIATKDLTFRKPFQAFDY